MDPKWEQLGDFIRERRNHAEMSLRKMADITGVSNPYLSQIERGLRRPSADILQQIAKALEISAESLYVQAGWLDEDASGRPERPEVLAAIEADPKLSTEQRRTLAHMYEAFVANAGTLES